MAETIKDREKRWKKFVRDFKKAKTLQEKNALAQEYHADILVIEITDRHRAVFSTLFRDYREVTNG